MGSFVVAVAAVATAVGGISGPVAQAVYANPEGGSGKYESRIDWIDWSEATITPRGPSPSVVPDGSTAVAWSTPNQVSDGIWRSSRCTLSEVESHFEGTDSNGTRIVNDLGVTIGYNVGGWVGDGLARLYNDGTNYDEGTETDPRWADTSIAYNQKNTRSNLNIGISNTQRGVTGAPANAFFKIECNTYLVTSAARPTKAQLPDLPRVEVPLHGMVYADAENSNNVPAYREGVTMAPIPSTGKTPADVQVRLLETQRSAGCTTNAWAGVHDFPYPTGTMTGYELTVDSNACPTSINRYVASGPTAVMYMNNARGGYVQLTGGGVSAIAFGVMTSIDYGDAPQSYGVAGSVFQPSWTGGALGTDIAGPGTFARSGPGTWYNMTAAAAAGRVAVPTTADLRLGADVDQEIAQLHSADASLDDTTDGEGNTGGVNDEDGITGWDGVIRTAPGETWTREVMCAGGGNVVAWLDWNRNGVFDATEQSTSSACPASGSVDLSWTVPSDVKRSVIGENGSAATFLRVRTTADTVDGAMIVPGPTGVTATGEVEDYQVQVHVPAVTIVKAVDNDNADASGLGATDWTVSLVQDDVVLASGTGGVENISVAFGPVSFSESSTLPAANGYQRFSLLCNKHPDSIEGAPRSFVTFDQSQLVMRGQDWMSCTLTNQAQTGEVVWQKLDQDGATPLGGTTWTLTGPNVPAGTVISDCDQVCSEAEYTDQDPALGGFRVDGLPWGNYSITETSAPQGYELLTGALAFEPLTGADLSATLVDHPGGVVNRRMTGSVTWGKVSENGARLTGSTWTLTGPGLGQGGVEVTDCAADSDAACPSGAFMDTDSRPGYFKIIGLGVDDTAPYQLVETQPPIGHELDDTAHPFTITVDDPNHEFTDPFVNKMVSMPGLPLTGGASVGIFHAVGAGLLGATVLGEVIRRRRRR